MKSPTDSRASQGQYPSHLPRLTISHGAGCRCWDTSGRGYIDFICGYGPVVLGHGDPEVAEAVERQLRRGILFAASSPALEELMELLSLLAPRAETSRIFKTGSEAIAAAVRLSRARTGRRVVLRCGFHGWHDSMVTPWRDWHDVSGGAVELKPVIGVSSDFSAHGVAAWDAQDPESLPKLFEEHRGDVACVLLDPVQIVSAHAEALRRIRDLCQTEGALFVLDECKTALRLGPQGIQGLSGVASDLTIVSKAIANGMPLAAVLGPREVLSLGDKAKLKGTYNTELASVAAATITIRRMTVPAASRQLADRGADFISRVNDLAGDSARAVPYRWPCMPHLQFLHRQTDPWRDEFYGRLCDSGVLMLPGHMSYVSMAHDEDAIAFAAAAVRKVVESMSAVSGERS